MRRMRKAVTVMELKLKEMKGILELEEVRLEHEFPGRVRKKKNGNGKTTPINRPARRRGSPSVD